MNEELYWADLDLRRMLFYSCTFITVVRGIVYPPVLVKTRLQAQEEKKYSGTSDAFRKIFRNEGPRGFYKGFLTTITGILPAQMIYITTYEWVRAQTPVPKFFEKRPETIQNFVGGGVASLATTAINVPIEVISQRLMLQDSAENRRYKGGFNALTTILQTEGVRGLYRGYFASIATFVPGSAIWWGTYGFLKSKLTSSLASSASFSHLSQPPYDLVLAAFSGLLAGCASAITTNPLDIAKTRIQTAVRRGGVGKDESMFKIIRELVRQEGATALSRGVFARILGTAPMSVMMIISYEQVKRLSSTREIRPPPSAVVEEAAME